MVPTQPLVVWCHEHDPFWYGAKFSATDRYAPSRATRRGNGHNPRSRKLLANSSHIAAARLLSLTSWCFQILGFPWAAEMVFTSCNLAYTAYPSLASTGMAICSSCAAARQYSLFLANSDATMSASHSDKSGNDKMTNCVNSPGYVRQAGRRQ